MTEAEIMIEDERRKEKEEETMIEEETQIGTEMTGAGRETETMTGGGRQDGQKKNMAKYWKKIADMMFTSKLKSTQMNIF